MIINKLNKAFQTRSDMPNHNWLGKEWHVVPDGSELANKIMKLFPRFDLVLDENDNIVDVVEAPKTEEEVNQERVAEIDKELAEIDNKGLTRVIEDIIDLTKISLLLPQTTKDLIARKKELREERAKLL